MPFENENENVKKKRKRKVKMSSVVETEFWDPLYKSGRTTNSQGAE